MPDNPKESFMHYVELHERTWGMDRYPDRPALKELLAAPVVAFWYLYDRRESRYVATLHTDLSQLNTYVSSMVVHNNKIRVPERRLAKLFVHQKPVLIKGVRLLLADPDKS